MLLMFAVSLMQFKFFEDSVFAHNYPSEYLALHPSQVAVASADASKAAVEAVSPYCK